MRAQTIAAGVLMTTLLASSALAQQPDLWRAFAEKVDTGADLDVRLLNGQHFRASLVQVRPDAVVLQPRTRVPVPVQAVSFDAIASLERRQEGKMSAGKAAALGAATGVGAFLLMMAILVAGLDD